MHAPNGSAPQQRSALERLLIRSWEYRHLRLWGGLRIGGGITLAVCGVLTLTFGGSDRKTYGWAALFLVPAAVALAFGYWQMTIARSAQEAGGGPPCAP
jgi:sugar phosphate permease